MIDKYVLDSSVWIELERNNDEVVSRVLPLFKKNQVCLIDVIMAEVLRGTKTKKDFNRLLKLFSNFNQYSTDWISVAEFSFKIAKKGYRPPLIDVYISQCIIENNKYLITHDKHFDHIAKVSKFKYEILSL